MSTITLGDLLNNIHAARQRMSVRNTHRLLFGQCEEVLLQLVERMRLANAKVLSQPDMLPTDPALTSPTTAATEPSMDDNHVEGPPQTL